MYRIIVSLMFLILSPIALACSVPMMGAKYDELIAVKKTTQNRFVVTAPKSANGLKYGAQITVEYYPNESGFRSGVYSKKLHPKEKGANYVASFELDKITGHTPFVQIFWLPEQCCLCGAYGKSKDLPLE